MTLAQDRRRLEGKLLGAERQMRKAVAAERAAEHKLEVAKRETARRVAATNKILAALAVLRADAQSQARVGPEEKA